MKARLIRGSGLVCGAVYAGFMSWLYLQQPGTIAEVAGGVASGLGAYRVSQVDFDQGLGFFRNGQYVEARSAFGRADPARRDARTQFYIAYSCYRQGWGRLYDDDALFRSGLEAVARAIEMSPERRVIVDDPDLGMKSADELKAELERGTTREPSDLNPLGLTRRRK